jgi:hypothetical protein
LFLVARTVNIAPSPVKNRGGDFRRSNFYCGNQSQATLSAPDKPSRVGFVSASTTLSPNGQALPAREPDLAQEPKGVDGPVAGAANPHPQGRVPDSREAPDQQGPSLLWREDREDKKRHRPLRGLTEQTRPHVYEALQDGS